jgi:hypothetical protein
MVAQLDVKPVTSTIASAMMTKAIIHRSSLKQARTLPLWQYSSE